MATTSWVKAYGMTRRMPPQLEVTSANLEHHAPEEPPAYHINKPLLCRLFGLAISRVPKKQAATPLWAGSTRTLRHFAGVHSVPGLKPRGSDLCSVARLVLAQECFGILSLSDQLE